MKLTLPTDSNARKDIPLSDGVDDYFPAIQAGVAKVSLDGNRKHNPGQKLHHARGKSGDHANCVRRHLMDVKDILAVLQRQDPVTPTPEQINTLLTEVNQLAWRALALGQEIHEKYGGAPLAPAAKLDERPEGRLDDEWKQKPPKAPIPPEHDIQHVLDKYRKEAERKAVPGEVFPRYPGPHCPPNIVYLSDENGNQY